MKKTDLKSKLSAVRNRNKKNGAAAQKRKASSNGESRNGSHSNAGAGYASSPRRGRLVVPIGLQTILAVVVCCSVLLVVGFIFYGAQQMEIQDLKKELKAYVADGLVPAGAMDSSVTLNVEAVSGRVDNLEKMMARAKDGALSADDLLWIGTELNAVQAESRILSDILNDTDADKNVRNAYADTIQGPIVVLQETYATLTASNTTAEEGGDSTGAAGDTGAFQSKTAMKKNIRWVVVILIVVVLALGAFLLRGKWLPLLPHRRKGKASVKRQASGKQKNAAVKRQSAPKAGAPKAAPTAHEHPFAGENGEVEAVAEGKDGEVAAEDGAEPLSEEDAFLAEAAALQRMAAEEREKARTGAAMAEPSAEELLAFDASVATQGDIEAEEDPLFRKTEKEE